MCVVTGLLFFGSIAAEVTYQGLATNPDVVQIEEISETYPCMAEYFEKEAASANKLIEPITNLMNNSKHKHHSRELNELIECIRAYSEASREMAKVSSNPNSSFENRRDALATMESCTISIDHIISKINTVDIVIKHSQEIFSMCEDVLKSMQNQESEDEIMEKMGHFHRRMNVFANSPIIELVRVNGNDVKAICAE